MKEDEASVRPLSAFQLILTFFICIFFILYKEFKLKRNIKSC